MSWRRVAVAVMASALTLSACGVPTETSPRDIPKDRVQYDLLAPSTTVSATQVPEATVNTTVYLLGPTGMLAPVQRRVSEPLSVSTALASLIQGATAAEQASGLRSAINQQTAVLGAEVSDGVAMVDVSDAFSRVGAQEQILALAQVVFTATETTGVMGVQILLNSSKVGVPRADGTLSDTTLTRDDYAALAPSS